MRVAPIALVYHKDPLTAMQNAALSSRVTHPYPTNSEACAVYTYLIVLSLANTTKEDLASTLTAYKFEDPDLKGRFAKYSDLASFSRVHEDDISSSGYVVHSLEASLWAFFNTSTFREGALRAVNLGDDADTVGAIYGGIAGAFYGMEEIPAEWLDHLQKKVLIDAVVEGILRLVSTEA